MTTLASCGLSGVTTPGNIPDADTVADILDVTVDVGDNTATYEVDGSSQGSQIALAPADADSVCGVRVPGDKSCVFEGVDMLEGLTASTCAARGDDDLLAPPLAPAAAARNDPGDSSPVHAEG